MFVSFFLPTDVRHSQPEFVFFQQLGRFLAQEIHFIAPDFFFDDPKSKSADRHFQSEEYQRIRKFTVPSLAKIELASKSRIPQSLFHSYRKKLLTEDRFHAFIQEEEIPEFTAWLQDELRALQKSGETIEALMTWRDCRSLKVAAESLGIPVIHNEYGHHREPEFEDTIYFDLEGTKQSSEPQRRFEVAKTDPRIDSLISSFVESHLAFAPARKTEGKVGVLLGVEAEKAFTLNLTPNDLLVLANELANQDNIIIRPHPWSDRVIYEGYVYDESSNLDFIKRNCQRFLTIYSNAGLELIAEGIQVDYLGPTPLTFLSGAGDVETMRKKLGFFLLCYLVPGDFLFSPSYYRWRLSNPTELQIAEKHFEYWKQRADQPRLGRPQLFHTRNTHDKK